jgi:hypothetical protein
MRIVGGVVVGYVVMAVLVMGTFSVAYLVLGADGAFRSGSYEPSGLWIGISFVLSFLAALAGGCVAATIARDRRGPLVLAGLLVVLGLLFAIPSLTAGGGGSPDARSGDVGMFEAMTRGRQPGWVALLTPAVGAAGVLAGGRARSPRPDHP